MPRKPELLLEVSSSPEPDTLVIRRHELLELLNDVQSLYELLDRAYDRVEELETILELRSRGHYN